MLGRSTIDLESNSEKGHGEDQHLKVQLPTKAEMVAMFAAPENSLETEMATIHNDLGHKGGGCRKKSGAYTSNKRIKRRGKDSKNGTKGIGI